MKVVGTEIWFQISWSRLARSNVADASGRVRAAPNLPYIWPDFGGSRTALKFGEGIRATVG